MGTAQDYNLVIAREVTYKTYVAGARGWEILGDESLDWVKGVKQGMGLRVGARVARSLRRTVPSAQGAGDLSIEAISKGMGLGWEACLGTGVSTLVSGSTFQQLFTLGDTPMSASIQKSPTRVDGTQDPISFLGCMVEEWEFAFGNQDIAGLKMGWDIGDFSTAQAYVAPVYPSAPSLFHFANASLSTGTLTAPTTTALASAATPTANVRGGKIMGKNKLRNDRFNMGGAGRKSKPTVGVREFSGELTIEYDSTTYRDLVLNDGAMTLLVQYTGAALSTGVETLQVALSEIKLEGELPRPNDGELILQSIKFTGLDNQVAAQPIWVVMRTADTTI